MRAASLMSYSANVASNMFLFLYIDLRYHIDHYLIRNITVVPTKSDSDEILCLQLFSKH